MIRPLSLVPVLLGLLSVFPGNVVAQDAHHPEITIAHKGITQLKEDIKLMLDLSKADERHWENWDGVIELFAFGLDYDRPIRVDVLSGLTPAPLMIYGAYTEPIDDLLHENLESADFVPKKITDTLYEMQEPEIGWFRILPNQKYAILIQSTKPNHNLLKQLIQKPGDPMPGILEVLAGKANVGVQLVNKAQTVEDQNKRTASFADTRAERMGLLQKRPQESTTEFDLRKGILTVYLDEVERLIVEAAAAKAQASLNAKTLNASMTFEAQGIENSSFAKSIALIGKAEDAFASVKKAEGSALSFRVNHPIDELRQKNTKVIVDLLRADVAARLKSSEADLTEPQKEASQKIFDGIAEVILDGVAEGNLNAFIESVPNDDGKFVTWGAVVAKDARRIDEALKLLPDTGEGNEANMAIETVNGVNIHQIKLRKGFLRIFDDVFGTDNDVYIATSDDMVWFATGPKSLDSLKKAIAALEGPADTDVILTVEAELRPWVKRALEITEAKAEPSDLDQQQTRREILLRLKQAVEALTEADDDIKFSMGIEEDTVSGALLLNTGMLRFAGTQLETFSKNSLE